MESTINFILTQATKEDLDRIARAFKERQNILNRQQTFAFSVGDRVTFEGRNGKIETGTVVKINRAKLQIRTEAGLWNVPAVYLKRAA